MIVLLEALNYRCLRYIRQELGRFQVLVGPNASGKSTFLDAVAFLGDLLRDGPEAAISRRAWRMEELVWNQGGSRFEIAVEMSLPEDKRNAGKNYSICRYEVAVGPDERSGQIRVLAETLWLCPRSEVRGPSQRRLFPAEPEPPSTIIVGARRTPPGWRPVVKKIEESGNDYFKSETGEWNSQFRFGPAKAAFANLPEDPIKFPVATWAKRFLMEGIQGLALNSLAMRQPSAPALGIGFRPDGSNLPFVVKRLQKEDVKRFNSWIDHVHTAMPDLKGVKVRDRPEDRHRYLTLLYAQGIRVPSWLASDGTLRLMALTLLAYLKNDNAVYLIEEPENGIHPQAVQAVFDSLSSAYDSQILVASHSPVFLRLAKLEQVLCFSKTSGGATDIVKGVDHPRLKDWQGEISLAELFAGGVLG